ncbi:hypothetical protein [Streptomyces sedi]|uniref:Uncharacterized protein n=1 Tax=Streptomyces sedi TaxID=555059 RepID=A0A5C4UW28_9ACTN|nr:hypothetical protein [Streptomyces sedi]TNM27738.1 hypothetical protein FH715_20240 [Streptomyces sedi]
MGARETEAHREGRARAHEVRAVVIAGGPLPAVVLMALHRLLRLGVYEVRRRVARGQPLVDVVLFRKDQREVGEVLSAVLDLLAPYPHRVHQCPGDAPPAEGNRYAPATLRRVIAQAADGRRRPVILRVEG